MDRQIGVGFVPRAYCFAGLNWISTSLMSCVPVLVSIVPGGCGW